MTAMQKFRFELEPLLSFKRHVRKQVEVELYRRRVSLDEATSRVAAAAAELEAAARVDRATGPWTVERLLTQRRLCELRQRKLETEREGQRKSQTAYDETARRYAAVDREIEALSTLREEQWRRHLRTQAQHGQRRIDEFVLRQWDQQRQAEEPAHG
jgi:hypothetical protein